MPAKAKDQDLTVFTPWGACPHFDLQVFWHRGSLYIYTHIYRGSPKRKFIGGAPYWPLQNPHQSIPSLKPLALAYQALLTKAVLPWQGHQLLRWGSYTLQCSSRFRRSLRHCQSRTWVTGQTVSCHNDGYGYMRNFNSKDMATAKWCWIFLQFYMMLNVRQNNVIPSHAFALGFAHCLLHVLRNCALATDVQALHRPMSPSQRKSGASVTM